VFSTLIAAASHTLAAGPPSALAVVLSLAFAGMLCVGLAGKQLSWARLAASVIGSQLMFHQLFASLGGAGWTPAVHVHGAADAAGALGMATMPAQSLQPSDGLWMVAAHAGAAVVTFVLLRFGERSFWSVSESARALLRILFPRRLQPVTLDALRMPRGPFRTPVVSAAAGRSALRYRGPPTGVRALVR
jgi:hypothetical protein